jgi:hypothetical protein
VDFFQRNCNFLTAATASVVAAAPGTIGSRWRRFLSNYGIDPLGLPGGAGRLWVGLGLWFRFRFGLWFGFGFRLGIRLWLGLGSRWGENG